MSTVERRSRAKGWMAYSLALTFSSSERLCRLMKSALPYVNCDFKSFTIPSNSFTFFSASSKDAFVAVELAVPVVDDDADEEESLDVDEVFEGVSVDWEGSSDGLEDAVEEYRYLCCRVNADKLLVDDDDTIDLDG